MENQINYIEKKSPSRWLFTILSTAFMSLYFLRDVFGVGVSYYVIYAVTLLAILVCSHEESLCFFLALSAYTNAGLNGIFCTILFVCALIRFAYCLKSIKLYSIILVGLIVFEFAHFISVGQVSIGSYLTFSMILLTLVVAQQFPHEKLNKDFLVNTFIVFSIAYVSTVIFGAVTEYGSLEELLQQGLRTEEFEVLRKEKMISPNQNYVTQLCSLNLVLCGLMISKGRKKLPYISAIIVFVVCGFLTISKMFVVVLVLFSLWILISAFKGSFLRGVGAFVILVIGVILVNYYFGETLIQMVMERFETEDLTTGRAEINQNLLEYMKAHPWMYAFGTGILQVHYVQENAIHSSFFEILGGWGVLGLLMVPSYLVLLVKQAVVNMWCERQRVRLGDFVPLLLLLGYTINGMLFSQAFTVVQIMVCIYAMQVKEKGEDVVQYNRSRV